MYFNSSFYLILDKKRLESFAIKFIKNLKTLLFYVLPVFIQQNMYSGNLPNE